MSIRNISPQEMFFQHALKHDPTHTYKGTNRTDFGEWKEETLPRVLETLGDFPERGPLNAELIAEWRHDGLIKQRWMIDVGPYISAILLCNKPKDIAPGEKRPAILCCHGHGQFGKEPVMGNESSNELRAEIKKLNYNYGHKMAKEGYVTFAIDWIGFGERNDSNKPNWRNNNYGRDWCNLYYLHATMLGMTSISINVTHGKAATDFVSSLPEVDANRLGVMGLSGGGTMTLWMTLCDERFKASEIIGYSDLWQYFGIRDLNYCGMQVAPGLYKLVNLSDLQGLIAPRPLLVGIGANDATFKIDTASMCFDKVKEIYTTADAADKLELDMHPGGHEWGANKSVDFFAKHLA